eukprot:1555059-Rhodomonas_salina.1
MYCNEYHPVLLCDQALPRSAVYRLHSNAATGEQRFEVFAANGQTIIDEVLETPVDCFRKFCLTPLPHLCRQGVLLKIPYEHAALEHLQRDADSLPVKDEHREIDTLQGIYASLVPHQSDASCEYINRRGKYVAELSCSLQDSMGASSSLSAAAAALTKSLYLNQVLFCVLPFGAPVVVRFVDSVTRNVLSHRVNSSGQRLPVTARLWPQP